MPTWRMGSSVKCKIFEALEVKTHLRQCDAILNDCVDMMLCGACHEDLVLLHRCLQLIKGGPCSVPLRSQVNI